MEELDSKSYKILKKLNKKTNWVEILDDRIIQELLDKKLIEGQTDLDEEPWNDIYNTGKYRINHNGKTFIFKHRLATRHRLIPIIISILALIISAIALAKP